MWPAHFWFNKSMIGCSLPYVSMVAHSIQYEAAVLIAQTCAVNNIPCKCNVLDRNMAGRSMQIEAAVPITDNAAPHTIHFKEAVLIAQAYSSVQHTYVHTLDSVSHDSGGQ